MEAAIRQKLHDAYMELAEQASTRRQWEAASAFQYAAGMALGMVVQIQEVRPGPKCTCNSPVIGVRANICLKCGGNNDAP